MTERAQTIDVHTHVVPPGLPFGHDERFASLVPAGDTADVLVAGRRFRTVTRAAWDIGARLTDLDGQEVELQVLSPMPELFSYWAEPRVGAAFCAALNESIAEMVSVDDRRFAGLGSLPLQHVGASIEELRRVRQLGLLGVQVGSNVNGESTGSLRFLPVFQAAADLGLCVFVHAFHPPHWECVADPPMAAAVNFPPEIGTCVAAMIANGIVAQSPGLRLGSSHGGGTLPLHLPRMEAFWGDRAASPADAARTMWFDCLAYRVDALRALLDLVGASRVMVGSDYPFYAPRPGYVLDELAAAGGVSPGDELQVRRLAALAFLGLGGDGVGPHRQAGHDQTRTSA